MSTEGGGGERTGSQNEPPDLKKRSLRNPAPLILLLLFGGAGAAAAFIWRRWALQSKEGKGEGEEGEGEDERKVEPSDEELSNVELEQKPFDVAIDSAESTTSGATFGPESQPDSASISSSSGLEQSDVESIYQELMNAPLALPPSPSPSAPMLSRTLMKLRLFNAAMGSIKKERVLPGLAPAPFQTPPPARTAAPLADVAPPAARAPARTADVAPAVVPTPAPAVPVVPAPAPTRTADGKGYRIHLGGIPWGWRRSDLMRIFHPYGIVDGEVIMRGKLSLGYAFLTIGDKEEAARCIAEMHGRQISTRKISVRWAH